MSATLLKLSRQVHLYLGVFTAPALLFFAFTGALQTFSLHETTKGSSYKPAHWIVTLGQLHKKQTTEVPVRKPRFDADAKPKAPDGPNPAAANAGSPVPAAVAPPPAPPQKSHMPMKIFFLIVSVGLFVSTLTGIYMAYKYNSNKLAVTLLLLAGIVIPIALLPF